MRCQSSVKIIGTCVMQSVINNDKRVMDKHRNPSIDTIRTVLLNLWVPLDCRMLRLWLLGGVMSKDRAKDPEMSKKMKKMTVAVIFWVDQDESVFASESVTPDRRPFLSSSSVSSGAWYTGDFSWMWGTTSEDDMLSWVGSVGALPLGTYREWPSRPLVIRTADCGTHK